MSERRVTRCRHASADWYRWDSFIGWIRVAVMSGCEMAPFGLRDHSAGARVDRLTCRQCGLWLSLGAAAEDDERVAIEVRAAELAATWQPEGGVRGQLTDDEGRGWNGWPHRQPLNDGEHCGFLAAQILHHESDLGPVNWAGHHMADYAINPDGSLPDATHPDTGGRDE